MDEKTLEMANTIGKIREYLKDPDNPFKDGEFAEFWRSLTDQEKAEFLQADLSQ